MADPAKKMVLIPFPSPSFAVSDTLLLFWALGMVRECWPSVTDLLKLDCRAYGGFGPSGGLPSSRNLGLAGLTRADTESSPPS